MSGINTSPDTEADILSRFPLASSQLPVRYLGLPLLTKRMTITDYLPLVENQETDVLLDWKVPLPCWLIAAHKLCHYQHDQLWLQAFTLPSSCLKEIESLCSAFLWSGPELKSSKAKVSWKDICLPKNEGGMGIRPLKEMNTVFCLKLIWRIVSARDTLWVRWIQCYLIRKGSFWPVNKDTLSGSGSGESF